ncbi:MAG TPA: non-canonical purine NTP pyrophosphatase [Peptococcaceae bacterium]|nr:non-canonical purine NTP pyrophosphatase [Peptococcaceae bacterium]
MNNVLIASRNAGKIEEYRELLSDLPLVIFSLADDNFIHLPEVEETGQTFQENALIKARAAAGAAGLMALADDSGLEVDYLQGAPGVYSSRYAGPGNDDQANNHKLLQALEGVPLQQRGGRFRCVIALVTPQGKEFFSEGVCEGRIAFQPTGSKGFGYDPLFLMPLLGKTFAELEPEVKNRISHRAQAIRAMRDVLTHLLDEGIEK